MNADHAYLPKEPYPEGRGLRGRRKGRVRFVRSEELGAPSPLHLTGPHRHSGEVACTAKESARMLPIKSSKVPPAPPRCCAASPIPLPSLLMLSSGLRLQPCTRGVKCSLSTSCMALAAFSSCVNLELAPSSSPWVPGRSGESGGVGGCNAPHRS